MKTLVFVGLLFSGPLFAVCKAQQPNQAVYPVNKMHCQACVDTIGKYFGAQASVEKAEVDLAGKCMVLSFRENMKMSDQAVKDGLEKLGYELAAKSVTSK